VPLRCSQQLKEMYFINRAGWLNMLSEKNKQLVPIWSEHVTGRIWKLLWSIRL